MKNINTFNDERILQMIYNSVGCAPIIEINQNGVIFKFGDKNIFLHQDTIQNDPDYRICNRKDIKNNKYTYEV